MKSRATIILVLLAAFCITAPVFANIKTFTHAVKQPFGGSQSPDDARVAAMAKAKREVLEMAGVYLESMTIVKNFILEKDEILALSAGILKTEIISQKNYATEDAFGIIVTAKVDVDTGIMEERIEKMLQDRSLIEKYQELRKRKRDLLSRIDSLERKNRELQQSSQPDRDQQGAKLKEQFRKATNELTAIGWNEKALALFVDGSYTDPDRALEYLDKAIRLYSTYEDAFNNRGIAWDDKGDYNRALRDYDKAINLNPGIAEAYNNRGLVWYKKKGYDRSIKDFSKAIELKPQMFSAYANRGLAWVGKGNYDRAIDDFTKVIQSNPQDAAAYSNRGLTRTMTGDYDRAVEDYTKALE
ncbi:MAG: tetratricopeptide repeat protein, partial [Deltaproteobacteria bacterium]|nr:tetratricopeptide repeat protein [Deltaproteobacteria bacterium]